MLKQMIYLFVIWLLAINVSIGGSKNTDYTKESSENSQSWNTVLAIPDGSYVLDNGYVRAGVSSDGTFGVGGNTTPGFMYDGTGTSNYGVDDYLTPGSPFEFFSVSIGDAVWSNNNDDNANNYTETTVTQSDDFKKITVLSNLDNQLSIVQTYLLNTESNIINVSVKVSNISDALVSDVKYARGIDPDIDYNTYSSFDTINTKGLISALGVISPENIVVSEGNVSGRALALYSDSAYAHNTSITSEWSSNPNEIILGINDGTGDNSMGIAFNLGDLLPGATTAFNFQYIFANDKEGLFTKIFNPLLTCDFNQNESNDLLWHNQVSGATKVMIMKGLIQEANITIVDASNIHLLPRGIGDFTGDNKVDILFHNDNTGNLRIWEMNGTTKMNNIQVLGSSNPNLKIAGIGDFDGDGDSDIATFNTNSGTLRIWVMDGSVRVDNIVVLSGANTNLVPRGAGDMDGDGIADIVLRNSNSGAVRVWTMNNNLTRKSNKYVTSSSNTNLELRGIMDINRDGHSDILNYNTNTGLLRAWLMDGNFGIGENVIITQDTDLDWSVRN